MAYCSYFTFSYVWTEIQEKREREGWREREGSNLKQRRLENKCLKEMYYM